MSTAVRSSAPNSPRVRPSPEGSPSRTPPGEGLRNFGRSSLRDVVLLLRSRSADDPRELPEGLRRCLVEAGKRGGQVPGVGRGDPRVEVLPVEDPEDLRHERRPGRLRSSPRCSTRLQPRWRAMALCFPVASKADVLSATSGRQEAKSTGLVFIRALSATVQARRHRSSSSSTSFSSSSSSWGSAASAACCLCWSAASLALRASDCPMKTKIFRTKRGTSAAPRAPGPLLSRHSAMPTAAPCSTSGSSSLSMSVVTCRRKVNRGVRARPSPRHSTRQSVEQATTRARRGQWRR